MVNSPPQKDFDAGSRVRPNLIPRVSLPPREGKKDRPWERGLVSQLSGTRRDRRSEVPLLFGTSVFSEHFANNHLYENVFWCHVLRLA